MITPMQESSVSLSLLEHSRLASLEEVINKGRQTFIEVGNALLEIRESRLYRETHNTFEDYCLERWDISKTQANRLVQSSEVAHTLTPIGVMPSTESQARELAPLLDRPDELRDIWAEVQDRAITEQRPVTAALVAEVRDTRMGVHYSSATDLWSTPQGLFDLLDAEFNFNLDVCATPENAKCSRFFTDTDDGLAQEWNGSCWMNPPYGDAIKDWMRKAFESANNGVTVVCLVPARVDTGWWWDYARFGEIRFLRGRLKFGGSETGAPFPSAVVVFPRSPNVVWWDHRL